MRFALPSFVLLAMLISLRAEKMDLGPLQLKSTATHVIVGDVRIYMARNAYDGFGKTNDDGFNVIGANGFEKSKE